MDWKKSLELGDLDLFVYFRKGGGTNHTGVVVAHNIKEAKEITSFPKTITQIYHISEVIDTNRCNSTELH